MKNFNKIIILSLFALGLISNVSAAVINFDNLSNGDYVSGLQIDGVGISVTAKRTGETWSGSSNRARVYSTNDFTNDDADLFANFDSQTGGVNDYNPGNILIIQESLSLNDDSDGLGNNPDDNAAGGVFLFKFDQAVTMNSIDLFDSSKENVTIALFNEAGDRLAKFKNLFNADTNNNPDNNLYGTVDFGSISDVTKVKVKFDGVSGGLDNIYFDHVSEVPEPSVYALMIAGLVMSVFFARRRQSKLQIV